MVLANPEPGSAAAACRALIADMGAGAGVAAGTGADTAASTEPCTDELHEAGPIPAQREIITNIHVMHCTEISKGGAPCEAQAAT